MNAGAPRSRYRATVRVVLTMAGLMTSAAALAQATIHVAPDGNDRETGSATRPVRSLERAQALVTELQASGGTAESVAFDLADGPGVQAALDALLAAGPIDVLVNNAGFHRDALLAGMRSEDWHAVIDANLNGFFRVTQPLVMPTRLRKAFERIASTARFEESTQSTSLAPNDAARTPHAPT